MTFIKLMEDAAAPFFLDRRGAGKILVGVLLSLLPVVSFFSLGYVLAILEERLAGAAEERLPEWRRPGDLFLRGMIFFLVILTYGAIPFVFTSAALQLFSMNFVFLPPALITLLASAALWLAALYVMPMAMVLFLQRGTVAAFFDLGAVYNRTSIILRPYAMAALLNLLLLAFSTFPALMHRAGLLITSPLTFLVMAYMASVYGTICSGAAARPAG